MGLTLTLGLIGRLMALEKHINKGKMIYGHHSTFDERPLVNEQYVHHH